MNERIKELAEQAGFISLAIYNMSDEIQRIVELAEVAAVAREREACAKVCEDLHDCEPEFRPEDCAAEIRARGEK